MTLAHQPLLQQAKATVEERLREHLPPGPGVAQHLGYVHGHLLPGERPVGEHLTLQQRRIQPFGHQFAEAALKLIEFRLLQRQARRHRVAAKLDHQPRIEVSSRSRASRMCSP